MPRGKHWTYDEIKYLRKVYPDKKVPIKEIEDNLNRSFGSVTKKAHNINVYRQIEKIEYGYKKCSACKQILPIKDFHKNCTSYDGLQDRCKKCKIQYVKQYHKKKKCSKSLIQKINDLTDEFKKLKY